MISQKDKNIINIKLGEKKIIKVYKGDKLIFSSSDWPEEYNIQKEL